MNAKSQIDVRIAAGEWRKSMPDAVRLCRRAAKAALEGAALEGAAIKGLAKKGAAAAREVSVILTGDADIRALNLRWRGKDKTTNVLAFPGATSGATSGVKSKTAAPVLLGDVVLALGALLAESATQSKPPREHMAHLVVHGVLHLLGFDHIRSRDAKAMEVREAAILKTLGIADPYLARKDRARKVSGPSLRQKA